MITTYRFRWTHATACTLAASAIAYQSALIWEMLAGVSLITKLGVPLATISAALLPVMAEAAWRSGQRGKAALLCVPVVVLLAFVLPSGISRLGEAQEARISAASLDDAARARLTADLDRANRLVAQSEAWVSTECASGTGPKCRGQQFTLSQRQAHQRYLAAKLADARPVTKPWLPVWHPALLPIGLEVAILAMLFYGLGPATHDRRPVKSSPPSPDSDETSDSKVVALAPRIAPLQAITERDFDTDPVTDEEIAKIRRLLGMDGLNNRQLAASLGCSEGQSSKIVSAAVAAGKLVRCKIGREVRITATH